MVTAVQNVGGLHAGTAPVSPYGNRPTLRTLLALGQKPDLHDPALRRGAAAQFVAELFFAPLLAEMRQFPLGRELATGGQTEAIFGEQLDQRIADQVAAGNDGLLQQIAQELERRRGNAAAERKGGGA